MNQNLISKLIMKTNATIYTIANCFLSDQIADSKSNPHMDTKINGNETVMIEWWEKISVVLSTQITHAVQNCINLLSRIR